jgi:hypothetical protein
MELGMGNMRHAIWKVGKLTYAEAIERVLESKASEDKGPTEAK